MVCAAAVCDNQGQLEARYGFLWSDDAPYITGQLLHPNGGSMVNG
jgi:hypothetical protein